MTTENEHRKTNNSVNDVSTSQKENKQNKTNNQKEKREWGSKRKKDAISIKFNPPKA